LRGAQQGSVVDILDDAVAHADPTADA
jgi:hypothetical protein